MSEPFWRVGLWALYVIMRRVAATEFPAVRYLNPTIRVGDEKCILATRLIGAVGRASLRRVGSASEQADEITRAVDILMAGV